MRVVNEPIASHRVKTELPPGLSDGRPQPVATFLGLFSIGLGLAELLCSRRVAEATGVRNRSLLQAYGAREIVSGLGILTTDRPVGWLWGRVMGDALDLATLAAVYPDAGHDDRRRIAVAATAVAGVGLLDLLCATEHCREA
jgi:hypothetical protein